MPKVAIIVSERGNTRKICVMLEKWVPIEYAVLTSAAPNRKAMSRKAGLVSPAYSVGV